MHLIAVVIAVEMIFDVLLNKKISIKERPEKLSVLCKKNQFLDLKKAFDIKKAQFQKAAGKEKDKTAQKCLPTYKISYSLLFLLIIII